MSKVLIACLKNFKSAQEWPFALKRGGCEVVDVLCKPQSSLLRNSFFDKWIKYESDQQDFYTLLLNTIEKDHYDWVIPGDDSTLKLLNESITDEKTFRKILPLTKIENREMLSSKVGLSEVCNRYSIVTPKYFIVNTVADLEKIKQDLVFPALTKIDVSQGGLGIRYCNNYDELYTAVTENATMQKIIVQEYISGKDIGVEALYKDGKLLTYNVADVLRYLDGRFGRTTKRRYFFDEGVEKVLVELGEKAGLNGFASIQYIYDQNKNLYYLVEADLRPNIWIASSRFTGNDFATGIKRFLNKMPVTDDCYKPANGYETTYEIALFDRDLARCFTKKPLGLLTWFFNPRYWKFIPAYDKKQLRFQTRNTLIYLKTVIKDDIKKNIRKFYPTFRKSKV